MISKLYRTLALALPLALGALSVTAGCGGKEETAPGEGRSVEIAAEEYKFVPSRITASPGQQLHITLKNNGKMEHSIKFDLPGKAEGLDRNIAPNDTGHLTITAPSKTGSYKFYSPVDDDQKKGMEGTLDVHTERAGR